MRESSLKLALSQLILLVPSEKWSDDLKDNHCLGTSMIDICLILAGKCHSILADGWYHELLFNQNGIDILKSGSGECSQSILRAYVKTIVTDIGMKCETPLEGTVRLLILAIALLHMFIQQNFTGPVMEMASKKLPYPFIGDRSVHDEIVKMLNVDGSQAYELINDPIYLVLSILFFEFLTGIEEQYSFINKDRDISLEEVVKRNGEASSKSDDVLGSSIQWWRARALWVHYSVLYDPSNVLSSVATILLNPSVLTALLDDSSLYSEVYKALQESFLLECARAHLHSHTEHLSVDFLKKAQKISGLELVLSGAKAKRTKFQKFYTTSLIVLAKSKESRIFDENNTLPEKIDLNSDLLLEKPEFEGLEDISSNSEVGHFAKRIKREEQGPCIDEFENGLLPIAMKEEDIPSELRALDPNSQPPLSDFDCLQLLMRLSVIKQTSPSNDPIVEEELMALVNRVLYTSSQHQNWSIYSRALWERSILETYKARTLERGILQMTSLVEEIGIKIKSRAFPRESNTHSGTEESITASRLRFIHVLPLVPQWDLDISLAEKYMSIGVLKSAVEIYERLGMPCETALCYAAVDNEKEAEKILLQRINLRPDDARAISILGDIRQDPDLWQKAWDISKYSKAKASLSHFYYSPPKGSGLTKNLELALHNMRECLTVSPLNYENWFFYGCCGLEAGNFELASEAFSRCVSLDDTNSHAWSNLATSLLKLNRTKAAFNALKKAIRNSAETNTSWRIYENYLTVAAKLNEWDDVLFAARELVKIKSKSGGEGSLDMPVIEKLVELLVTSEYPTDETARLSHFQTSCIDLVCNILPKVITRSSRAWRLVAKVQLWRKRPWDAIECHEKAFRALVQRPELGNDETAWNDAVEGCEDLVSAYESLGDLPGKYGPDSVVCSDWKFKARSSVRTLLSKGKTSWEDSDGWVRLQNLKLELTT